ncbi:acyltransferase [Rhizobium ruizarguesonis]|jgi:hypothetical protein|uniref:acyltransferase n=1 Tax=Rhizobium ruizarguesonis TaxID=2081791 RepID=UPI0010300FC8|nr:acyltransferase [Rhizobium ruizarguesonis]TAZ83484.1 acyltransferase [Rhizobium ruizarguesonis]
MSKILARTLITGLALLGFVGSSSAGENAAALIKAGLEELCAQFGAQVSASEGNFKSRSKYNCLGAFQFCPGTFELYYDGSAENFLNTPEHQIISWRKYERTQWGLATKYNLVSLVGSQVCFDNKCGTIDASAILMACQFGCGSKGKLANYLRGRDCNARNVKDGNLVSVCRYLLRGMIFEVSCFTSGKPMQPVAPVQPSGAANCSTPAETVANGRMEIEINNFSLRFEENAGTDNVRRIVELLRTFN